MPSRGDLFRYLQGNEAAMSVLSKILKELNVDASNRDPTTESGFLQVTKAVGRRMLELRMLSEERYTNDPRTVFDPSRTVLPPPMVTVLKHMFQVPDEISALLGMPRLTPEQVKTFTEVYTNRSNREDELHGHSLRATPVSKESWFLSLDGLSLATLRLAPIEAKPNELSFGIQVKCNADIPLHFRELPGARATVRGARIMLIVDPPELSRGLRLAGESFGYWVARSTREFLGNAHVTFHDGTPPFWIVRPKSETSQEEFGIATREDEPFAIYSWNDRKGLEAIACLHANIAKLTDANNGPDIAIDGAAKESSERAFQLLIERVIQHKLDTVRLKPLDENGYVLLAYERIEIKERK